MIKYLLSFVLFITCLNTNASVDIIDDIADLFQKGDTKEISKYFSSSVELTINDEENVYSKVQAELILNDFFKNNTPLNSKVVHKVTSNANYKFGVIMLETKKNNFRTSYELKNTAGKFQITQIRIEANK